MFTATLDTSVLWPSLQRDFLLSLAIEGTYRPTWSSAILDELQFHEEAKLVKRGMPVAEAARRAATLIAAMRREFADAEVDGWQPLERLERRTTSGFAALGRRGSEPARTARPVPRSTAG